MPNNNYNIKLVVYTPGSKEFQNRFVSSVSMLLPKKQIIQHFSIENIESELRRFDYYQKIYIILVTLEKELDRILCLKKLLSDKPIILILPNQKSEIVSKAFKLYPRYISYQQDKFKNVKLVLQKMINNYASKEFF
ncbi:MAG: hypothetical protein GY760_16390 [Deltaproteobacteria bacterium]|nr:hypothetical protein [Deltaproteobacteria bacterium]